MDCIVIDFHASERARDKLMMSMMASLFASQPVQKIDEQENTTASIAEFRAPPPDLAQLI